ncbi:DUF1152 domain-containing protein [Streptomyces ferrugineus]|uniref:DUF1152 domain-containing protein n=1 Tax=Streptomyces ferrugineus TaxID=1413221 RepID=A0A7M2SCU0_9ACTN|nr:DUF1152 domain-containing protein [Streptomyces ferrugineus]QOV33829.1 DUF1152 domain-containing protein [Streptomyces ferrugineus]
MSDLFIAAGGGGDPVGTAITAATVGRTLTGAPLGESETTIATYAWERPEVDPTPGPLGAEHFTGLTHRAGVPVITPTTRAITPAGSTLPDLAAHLPARLVLLDPWQGLTALAEQIRRLADTGHDHVRIVDVGGDILAHGDEKTLCSPLVDALALAACRLAGVPATVYVAGPGTDGEIPRTDVLDRLSGGVLTPLTPDLAAIRTALSWHPSEASALFAAAIEGVRGPVRTVSRLVPLSDESARVHSTGLDEALAHNTVAAHLLGLLPQTLEAAADLSAELTGIHELDRERVGAAAAPAGGALPESARAAREAIREAAQGAPHVTLRFAARALGLTWRRIPALRALLGADGPVLPVA